MNALCQLLLAGVAALLARTVAPNFQAKQGRPPQLPLSFSCWENGRQASGEPLLVSHRDGSETRTGRGELVICQGGHLIVDTMIDAPFVRTRLSRLTSMETASKTSTPRFRRAAHIAAPLTFYSLHGPTAALPSS